MVVAAAEKWLLQWHPAITKCHGTNKNIRYSRVPKLNRQAEQWDIHHAKLSTDRLASEQLHLNKAIVVLFGLSAICIIMSFLLTASYRCKLCVETVKIDSL